MVPLLPDLPDLDSARAVYGWLKTDDLSFDLRKLAPCAYVKRRFLAPAIFGTRISEALQLPRYIGDPEPPWRQREWRSGRSEISPLDMIERRWSYAYRPSEIKIAEHGDLTTRVGDLGRACADLTEARQAVRAGGGNRKRVKELAERVAALSGPALAEYRDTRASLRRWVDAWEPAEPQRPAFAAPTNKRGNSWR